VQAPRFNSQWVTEQISIPANSTCDSADSSGCWTCINVGFRDANVYDTTTWTAEIAGDAVRLVQ